MKLYLLRKTQLKSFEYTMNEINFDEDQKNVFHQMTFFHSNENNIEYEFLNEKTTNIIDENNDHLRLITNDHEYYNELSNLARKCIYGICSCY